MVDDDGENMVVTDITPTGLLKLLDILIMLQEGDTVEQICENLGWSIIEFRVFYATCNLMGAVDHVEHAMKSAAGNA